ncbi:MAG TPA: sugar kinase [Flavobacteriales bacterium]|nr:sugar kinase [Flavobacteriales bacterium]|tara:strand:- start:2526 stop:3452 length:927 start_codon:yes stop_codon:yes gene_type:complete
MSLVTVGTVAFDAIQTPFASSGKIVGGAASYISLSASHFAKEQHIISVIGDDFPQSFIDELESRGVNTEGLECRTGEKSFFWEGKYHMDMNARDTLTTDLNVLADFKPVVPKSAKGADYVMLGNLDPDVQMSVLDQMAKRPKLVVLDTMNFWMDIALEPLKSLLKRVDVLTINDEEARQLSGEYSLVKAAQSILAMGPSTLVIKKGEHGALLFNKEEVFFAPALPLEEVLDPTGAGDSFAGGFIGHLANTNDTSFANMKRAVVLGSALASFTCEQFGTERLRSLTQEELDQRIQRFVDLVDFDIVLKG